MSMKRSLLAAAFALSAIASPVLADTYQESFGDSENAKSKGVYVTLGAGLLTVDDITYSSTDYSVDDGFTMEAGLGYRFNQNFRTEVTWSGSEVSDGVDSSNLVDDVVTHSLLFNAYYDFANSSKWTPYVGAGLGSVAIDTDASSDDDDDASTWQAKLGVSYDTGARTDVFAEATYQEIGESNIGDLDWDEVDTMRYQLGLRYFF